jgi:hypothetical protein
MVFPALRHLGSGPGIELQNREQKMDAIKIIMAHVAWKQRLLGYIDGTSKEELDPAVVCRDDQCALGKWIYGEGKSHETLPIYEAVRKEHAQFHEHAATIVTLVNEGNGDAARQLLQGNYSKISERLKHYIVSLNNEVEGE